MAFVFEIEAVTTTRVFQRLRPVDEERGVVNLVFVAEFGKEPMCEDVRPGRFERCVQQFVRFGINGGVQPVFFVVESDHCFIHRDEIRALSGLWL